MAPMMTFMKQSYERSYRNLYLLDAVVQRMEETASRYAA
jgi:hypothetical protein